MTTGHWTELALTNDSLIAELLLRMKHSTDPNPPIKSTPITTSTAILPPLWGNRKNRSKSTPLIAAGFIKEHLGSPTTHLSWSGGAGSTSDGCDDSSRRSDPDSGSRSVKANEGTSTSSISKSHKRTELTSTLRVAMNHRMTTSKKLKRIQVDQNWRNKAVSCKVEAEIESIERGFVLPDLNMTPNDDDLVMLS